jgi:hypothetical protein
MAAVVILRDRAIKPLLAAAQEIRPARGAQNPTALDKHYEDIRVAMQGVFRELGLAAQVSQKIFPGFALKCLMVAMVDAPLRLDDSWRFQGWRASLGVSDVRARKNKFGFVDCLVGGLSETRSPKSGATVAFGSRFSRYRLLSP